MGPLDAFLADLTRLGGLASAAEALVADAARIHWRGAAGYRLGGEPLMPATGARFDAASLTKPWMATLALVLDARGELPLAGRIVDLCPRAQEPLAGRTLEDLLRHRAGSRAWTPLALRLGRRVADPDALEQLLVAEATATKPVYSDLGYIFWGLLAERHCGARLADLLDARVSGPLGIEPVGELAAEPPRPVECRLDNGREVELAAEQGLALGRQRPLLLGRPQDGNVRALGRLAGHAGLFPTVDELLALGREWLRPAKLLSAEQVERAWGGGGDYALGWARWSPEGSSGPALSRGSVGHTGFTGGSLWIDPERSRIYLLLAHRLSSRIDFNPVRREFHRLAAAL